MPPFFDRLADRAQSADSLLCVGLDPHPELLPESTAAAARQLCLRLIEATAEHACAFKPNSAFFERFGGAGWEALREVIAAVPPEIPVILDAKRGDIASTAQAYAAAAFDGLGAGAITLSPYLGQDALRPFLAYEDRGILLLCKTSNPGANEVQRLEASGEPLFVQVARLAQRWAGPGQLGLVAGATDVDALASVRAAAPEMWILAPGVGPQGGELGPALQAGLRPDGLGLLLPVSRAIAAAPDPGREAARLRQAINAVRTGLTGAAPDGGLSNPQASLADRLLEAGCVRFGQFTLKDGSRSPIYFDLRLLTGRPALLAAVAEAYLPLLSRLDFDRLAAVPYAGIPIGTALALRSGKPLIYPRRERKAYGTSAAVEGGFHPGETAVVVDDLATSGGSKLEAIQTLRTEGLQVDQVVVLIDRQAGAAARLAQIGCRLQAVFTLTQLLDHWEARAAVAAPDLAAARALVGVHG